MSRRKFFPYSCCWQSSVHLPPAWSSPAPWQGPSPWQRSSWWWPWPPPPRWRRPPPTHEAATCKWYAQLLEEALPRNCWSRCVACESWGGPSCWVRFHLQQLHYTVILIVFSASAPSAPCSSLARHCPHTDMELVQELSSFTSSDSSNQLHSRPKRGATIHKFYAHEAYNSQENHPQEVFPQPRKRRRLRWTSHSLVWIFTSYFILVCLLDLLQGATS